MIKYKSANPIFADDLKRQFYRDLIQNRKCSLIQLLQKRNFYAEPIYTLAVESECPDKESVLDDCSLCREVTRQFVKLVETNANEY